jgi:hypothetical protein
MGLMIVDALPQSAFKFVGMILTILYGTCGAHIGIYSLCSNIRCMYVAEKNCGRKCPKPIHTRNMQLQEESWTNIHLYTEYLKLDAN